MDNMAGRRYYSLLHRMAEESSQKQDSTMLNATLAFMYAYLKEFMLSVEDANQAGDFCAEQMQVRRVEQSKRYSHNILAKIVVVGVPSQP